MSQFARYCFKLFLRSFPPTRIAARMMARAQPALGGYSQTSNAKRAARSAARNEAIWRLSISAAA
jgi:hypothetical protein